MGLAQATSSLPEKSRARLALLLLVPVPSLGAAAGLLLWPEALAGKAVFALAKIWILLLPVVWIKMVDRQPLSWSPPRQGGFGLGAVTGLAIAAAIVVTYLIALKTGFMDRKVMAERAAQTGLNNPALYVGAALYWITFNSLMEEYVWRWFTFRKCEILLGSNAAVVAAALGFTAHHVIAMAAQFNVPVTILASAGVFLGGLIWSGLYLRYQSIWPCYLSHALVDVPIFLIGYDLIFRHP
jgi:hypothetical protein